MFHDALWESRSHAKNIVLYLMFIPLVTLISIPFLIHFFGFGLLVAIVGIVTVAAFVVLIIIGRKYRWHNNKLVFAFTEQGIFFGMEKNNSYFHETYSHIAGYGAIPDGEFATVTIYFTEQTNAGTFGNITSLQMVRIAHFDTLKTVLDAHNIAQTQPESK